MNIYSILAGTLATFLTIMGWKMLYFCDPRGIPIFAIGAILILIGLRGPKSTTESPTEKIWLITWLGKQTIRIETGLTFVLNWPLNIVGFIEVDLKKVDHDFPLKKSILCKDGAYVGGFTSVSMSPDAKDDNPDKIPKPKSGGEKIKGFVNYGGMEGMKTQIDDLLTAWLQEYANTKDTVWMEKKTNDVSEYVLDKIKKGKKPSTDDINLDIDDTTGFGLEINKFQVILFPIPKVIDARNDFLVEKGQRRAELLDTKTMNMRIAMRYRLYEEDVKKFGGKMPSIIEIRNEIFQEAGLKAELYQTIANQGGVNIADVTQKRKGGK